MEVDKKTGSRRAFRLWLAVVLVAVIAAFFVPYGILSAGEPGLSVYGFWSGFALLVVVLVYWGVRNWRDPE